jgi:UDP-N-acetylmuramoylalanine--D-glutamate ligase
MKEILTLNSFKDKRVLVFGFGTNGGGLGTVQFLLKTDASEIIVTDQKNEDALKETIAILPDDKRITWKLGGHSNEDFEHADIVIKNPSIRWDNPYVLVAREQGARVLMDSSIFFALCKAPIIGTLAVRVKLLPQVFWLIS